MFPSLRGRYDLTFVDPAEADLQACDVVFFATPHGVAMAQARELVGAGVRIIDLAADFRLADPAEFERWYKMPHACPDLLTEAVYGLPEMNREAIRKRADRRQSRLLSDRRAARLPAAGRGGSGRHRPPDRRLQVGRLGRGTQGRARTHRSPEAADNFSAYGVKGHRHLPEIVQGLNRVSSKPVKLVFTPHLVPMIRGILATLYAPLTSSGVDLQALYEKRYAGEPFVDVMPPGSTPDTRSVRASNMLRIAVHRPPGHRPRARARGRGQPGQGRRRPGDPEHEPDVRAARGQRPDRAGRGAVGPTLVATSFSWRRGRQGGGLDTSRPAGRRRSSWWSRIAIGVVLAGIAAGVGWWGLDVGPVFDGVNRKEIEATITGLEAEAGRLRGEAATLRARNTQLESDLAMSRGSEQALTRQASDLAAENAQLKEERAFWQKLIAESGKQVELSIPRLSAEREADGLYRYSFLVVRSGNPKEEFDGHAVLQAVVWPMAAGGEIPSALTVMLPDDQAESRPILRLKFKYYQRIEGMLRIPSGYRLTSLTAQAFENGSANPRVTRSLTNP